MSAKKNNISQSTQCTERSDQTNTSSSEFIDDYSHLRLSYYQHRGPLSDVSGGTSEDKSEETFDTVLTDLSEVSQTSIDDEKQAEIQKLREYNVTQIPDLPDPSYVAASIISSASHKMGPVHGVHFKYNDRIEQGSRVPASWNDLEFDPQRRSTMKPNQFVIPKQFM
ncbi:hypothetical protein PYW08_007578 [Mythimna loreyi]|uniref:Uncharacterized protein n=1 Tax=Mythimna loreyi TaxID=667449 RepID=A0ACC2QC61_9NEOP|nr:hypothetical protein PYW08_007578 [Mythimna loreyi]